MWAKPKQLIRAIFRCEPRKFNFVEPPTHRLNPRPDLPRGLMSAIAPAYEEAWAREKREAEVSRDPPPKA